MKPTLLHEPPCVSTQERPGSGQDRIGPTSLMPLRSKSSRTLPGPFTSPHDTQSGRSPSTCSTRSWNSFRSAVPWRPLRISDHQQHFLSPQGSRSRRSCGDCTTRRQALAVVDAWAAKDFAPMRGNQCLRAPVPSVPPHTSSLAPILPRPPLLQWTHGAALPATRWQRRPAPTLSSPQERDMACLSRTTAGTAAMRPAPSTQVERGVAP